MSDVKQPWISMAVTSNTPMILESSGSLPDHLKKVDMIRHGHVVKLETLLQELEVHGHTRIGITSHKVERVGSQHNVEQEKYLAFKMQCKAARSSLELVLR